MQDERKLGTVLFADIVASTSAIQDLEPDGALDLLRPAIADMAESVRLFGGTVNRVTGDGLMALFGVPVADEEHALSACCAALDMLTRQGRGPGVQLRIGVHSGEFVVHALSVGDLTGIDAAGVAVHVAARLQQQAGPGEAWISEATARLARGRITAEPIGLLAMRGIDQPVPALRLRDADRMARGPEMAGPRDSSPFVGREAELAVLAGAFARLSEGRGAACLVVGEAGIGKSRLVREFLQRMARGAPVLRMGGVRWRRGIGFHALSAITQAGTDRPADDADALAMAQLRAALVAVMEDPQGQAATGLLPSERWHRTIAAAQAAVLAWKNDRPRILVVEDAHWLDRESAEVLRHMSQALSDHPILMVITARPEMAIRLADGTATIALGPLPSDSAAELATAALARHGSSSANAVAAVVARCDGNPFFIEEAAALPDPTAVPDSVRPLLAMRIDALDPQRRALVDIIAAMEEPLEVSLLAILAREAGGTLALPDQLRRLEAAGFLAIQGTGTAQRVGCRHALLQEVVYGALTRRRRVALHARISEVLDSAGAVVAEQVELLARHSLLGQRWEACLVHSEMAARKALGRFANRDAVVHIENAITALGALPRDERYLHRAVDLRLQLRDPLFRLGRMDALRRHLLEAGDLAAQLHDTGRLAQLRIFEIHHLWLTGDLAGAGEAIGQAQALARSANDAALALRTRFQEGLWFMAKGRYGACVAAMEDVAAGAADPAHGGRFGLDPPLVVVALGYSARVRVDLGDIDGARHAADRCLGWAAQVARPFSHVFATLADGCVLSGEGRHGEAVARLEEALAQCGKADSDLMRVVCLMLLGVAEDSAGRAAVAVERLSAAVAMAVEIGFMVQQPLRVAFLARALLAAGSTAEAGRRAAEALGEARRQGNAAAAALALVVLGQIEAAGGRQGEASARGREAAALARECGLVAIERQAAALQAG